MNTLLPDKGGDRTSAELARLVRFWRERLNPLEIPGLVLAGSHRRKNHVSQEDVARLIGVSNVWYGKLERGEPAHYSADFLDRTAIALRLSDDERMMLYLYASGHEPPPRRRQSRVVITESLRQVLDKQTWPTYMSDDAWDIIAYNRKAKEWFPWLGSENNVMRWVFTYPEARQQLHDWPTAWASPMLAQMRVAHARDQGNERLAALIQEILRDAVARRIWSTEPAVYVHPDGDRRKIYLPYSQELVTVEIVALSPLRAPNVRLMMLVPC